MSCGQNTDLPLNVTNVLPAHAKDIYRKAINNAWTEYKDPVARRDDDSREEVAHRVAWQAVKQTYEKTAGGNNWNAKKKE